MTEQSGMDKLVQPASAGLAASCRGMIVTLAAIHNSGPFGRVILHAGIRRHQGNQQTQQGLEPLQKLVSTCPGFC